MTKTSIFHPLCLDKHLLSRKQANDYLKLCSIHKLIISFIIFAGLLAGCNDDNHKHGDTGHGHLHGDETHKEAPEPVSYTLYTDNTELFVEFKPLIVGKTSKFAVHLTSLGGNFKAVKEGFVIVKLIGNKKQLIDTVEKPSSPGIFRLALTPKNRGTYKLIFLIQTNEYSDKIIIPDITVYPDIKSALENQQKDETPGEEIVYLKEQAWKIEFANMEVKKHPFTEVIKTTGQIRPANGDEVIITAKSKGVITWGSTKKLVGSSVNSGETLCMISGAGLTEGNLDTKYKEVKNNYEKNKIDFERVTKLAKDDVVSQKQFQETQLKYKNSLSAFNVIEKNYTDVGQNITSPIQGYIKSVMVSEGEYVEIGQPIASVSQNLKLILTAEVPQNYFSKLSSISSANFITAYNGKIYSTDNLNGKLISYGKTVDNNAYYIPVNFEIENKGEILPGSFVEVLIKTSVIKDALVIPYLALIEEQGNYFVYVQTSGEGFQKRELKIGPDDGMNVQILAGISEGERVVIKGGYQIKLATMSGKMPAHGHEH